MRAAQIALVSVGKQAQQLPLRWCAKCKPSLPMELYRYVGTKTGCKRSAALNLVVGIWIVQQWRKLRVAWQVLLIATGSMGLQVLNPFVNDAGLNSTDSRNQCTPQNRPPDSKRTFKCDDRDCEVLERRSRKLSNCFSLKGLDCGDEYRMTENFCYSVTQSEIVPLTDLSGACEGVTQGPVLEQCTGTSACDTFFYQYTPWSACSATCDACAPPDTCDFSGSKDRTATCSTMTAGNVVAATPADCSSSASTSESCAKKCFHPLRRFKRTQGECVFEADCGVEGTATVEYTACTGGSGCRRWPNVTAAGPGTRVSCPALPCDPCATAKCSDVGTEASASEGGRCKCTCKPGFKGSRCHIEEGKTYKVRSSDGKECESGVIDIRGQCCASTDVDGCGYCTGSTVPSMKPVRVGYDINGLCCAGDDNNAFLTRSFTCCASLEKLDECGVCGGSGDTCSKAVSGSLAISAGYSVTDFINTLKQRFPESIRNKIVDDSSSARRRLLQTPSPAVARLSEGVSTSAAELTTAFVLTGVEAFSSGQLSSEPATPSAVIQGTPGNGVCETGEVAGSEDCPNPQSCPTPTSMDDGDMIGNAASQCAGKGICNRATGVCQCPPGYLGDACDRCDEAQGYVAIPTSDGNACSLLEEESAPAPATTPSPAAPPSPPAVDKDSGLGAGVIVGIVVGVVGGVAILVGVGYYVVRVRGAKEVSPV